MENDDNLFVRLTEENRKDYISFRGLDNISDTAIEFVVINANDIYELLELRFLDNRISNIIDQQIVNIYYKLRRRIITYPELGILVDREINNFDDLVEWYKASFYNTPYCKDYHPINKCIITAIRENAEARFYDLLSYKEMPVEMVSSLLAHERYSWFFNIPITDAILRSLINLPEINDYRYYVMIDNLFSISGSEEMILEASLSYGTVKPYIMVTEMIISAAKTGISVSKYLKYFPVSYPTELSKRYAIYLVKSLIDLQQYSYELLKLSKILELDDDSILIESKL